MNERECRSASSSILDPSMTTYTITYRIDILVNTRKIAIFAQPNLKAKQKPFQLCIHTFQICICTPFSEDYDFSFHIYCPSFHMRFLHERLSLAFL